MRIINFARNAMFGKTSYKGQKVERLWLSQENGKYFWHVTTPAGTERSKSGYDTSADAKYTLLNMMR